MPAEEDILHELVHYGRYWNNLPQYLDTDREAGHAFESWAFGRDRIDLYYAKQKREQYGWSF